MRTTTTIRIDSEILQTAQAVGLNISKASEYALAQMIGAIQGLEFQNNPFLGEASFGKEGSVVGPLGFEPRIANAPGWYTKPSYTTTPQG